MTRLKKLCIGCTDRLQIRFIPFGPELCHRAYVDELPFPPTNTASGIENDGRLFHRVVISNLDGLATPDRLRKSWYGGRKINNPIESSEVIKLQRVPSFPQAILFCYDWIYGERSGPNLSLVWRKSIVHIKRRKQTGAFQEMERFFRL